MQTKNQTNGYRTLVTLISALLMAILPSACNDSDTVYVPPLPEQPGIAEAPTASVQISISKGAAGRGSSAFGTNPLEVPFGATVTWTNNDSTPHTVTANDGSSFDSGPIKPGGTYSHTFTRSGSYGYYCTIHGMGSMSGVIEVQ